MKRTTYISLICCIVMTICSFSATAQSSLREVPCAKNTVAEHVVDEASRYIGTPYRWGGKTPLGFDCAGFVRFVYSKFGVQLSSGAAPQYRQGKKLKTNELQKGDLVFFEGRTLGEGIGHVGIVTDVAADGKSFHFIHASTTSGVVITSSKDPYYRQRYICACRVIDKVVSNLPTGA